jgi:hypothetical protein
MVKVHYRTSSREFKKVVVGETASGKQVMHVERREPIRRMPTIGELAISKWLGSTPLNEVVKRWEKVNGYRR